MSKFEELSDEFYIQAIQEINSGVRIEKIRELIPEMAEEEMYEACDGITRAIEDIRFFTLLELVRHSDEALKDKIKDYE